MFLRNLAPVFCFLFATLSMAENIPHSSHVWVIAEENHSLEEVAGNSKMPYYNQLIHEYGLATQFYANQHSSLPALMWFVAGAPVTRDNDTVSCNNDNNNVVRELLKQGYTWRSYQQSLPSAGYQGLYGGRNRAYYRRHNPLIDFSDACPGTGQERNSVPYSQMARDFAEGNTVNYAFITPDVDEDAHSGTLEAADQWLKSNLPAILARPEFGAGGDGILFIVWDEGNIDHRPDNRCSATVDKGCGGRTATLVIGPRVRAGYKSTTTYHNESVLKTVCVAMGLSRCPGAAQDAEPMADFFKSDNGPDSPSDSIVVSTPGNGATVAGPVHLIASASESQSVSQTEVWDNGTKLGVYGAEIDATYNMAPGRHTTTVVDLDSSSRALHQSSVTYSVQAVVDGLEVISPTPGETINTATVHVVAHATEPVPVGLIEVWDNDVELGRYPGADVNQIFSLAPGAHTVVVRDLDDNFDFLHQSSISYSVQ
jgi:phosphatidylinositol-3-phosphatase